MVNGARADSEWALCIQDLCKTYDAPAVDHLSLRIRRGELYALLGPNGAGKTTTLKMVTGLLRPIRAPSRSVGSMRLLLRSRRSRSWRGYPMSR